MPNAARLGDPIGHSPTMSWLLTGLLIGAGIAIAAVAIVGTGGLAAAAIVGGAAAAGAGLGEFLSTMSWAPKDVVGKIISGSANVFINGLAAARAHVDKAECSKHPKPPKVLATGSGNVYINGMPAVRVGDKTACSADVTDGSGNVYIGGGTQQTDDIAPEDLVPGWVHAALFVVGIGSAVVLAGPIVAGLGLAGGLGGGALGSWAGGKLFGEGSDGQKWSMLAGAVVGGGVGGRGGSMAANKFASKPTVSLYGFRGAGSVDDLAGPNAPHPYTVTGHVGYSFDGGKTIYGFGPSVPKGMSGYEAVQSLRNKAAYPGQITDDTVIFRSVATKPAIGRDGKPQVVIEQKIPMSKAEFDAAKARHDAIGLNKPMDDVLYGFPNEGACTFNCATFPSKIGIPIPEKSGNLRNYIPNLEQQGEVWVP